MYVMCAILFPPPPCIDRIGESELKGHRPDWDEHGPRRGVRSVEEAAMAAESETTALVESSWRMGIV